MAFVWTCDVMPSLHAATLHVFFRILASLSRCWFGCVFSQASWLLYNVSPIALKEIRVDHMPIICHLCASDIRRRTMFTENEYIFQNTGLKYPNLKRGHTEFWIMHGRHGISISYIAVTSVCSHLSNGSPVLLKSMFVFKLKLLNFKTRDPQGVKWCFFLIFVWVFTHTPTKVWTVFVYLSFYVPYKFLFMYMACQQSLYDSHHKR